MRRAVARHAVSDVALALARCGPLPLIGWLEYGDKHQDFRHRQVRNLDPVHQLAQPFGRRPVRLARGSREGRGYSGTC
jgi:hypothetical protein